MVINIIQPNLYKYSYNQHFNISTFFSRNTMSYFLVISPDSALISQPVQYTLISDIFVVYLKFLFHRLLSD